MNDLYNQREVCGAKMRRRIFFAVIFFVSPCFLPVAISGSETSSKDLFLAKIESMPKRTVDGRILVDTTFRELVLFSVLSSNNLAISLNDIKKAVYDIQKATGAFDPILSVVGSSSIANQPGAFLEDAGSFTVGERDTLGMEVGIKQTIPLGMRYSVKLGSFRHRSKTKTLLDDYSPQSETSTPEYHNNYLAFDVSIPIFELGDGNVADVNAAAANAKRSTHVSTELIYQIITEIGNLYYDFYGLFRQYDAQKIRMEYSARLLTENRLRFQLGAVDRITLNESENILEIDRQNLKTIQFRLINFDDRIKQALKLENLDYGIYPLETLKIKPFDGNVSELIEMAYAHDSTLKRYEKDREITRYRYEQVTSADKPDVTLSLRYQMNGFGFDSSQAAGNMFKNKTDDYGVTLTWNIPLGNNTNQSLIRQNILASGQTDIRVDDRKSVIKLAIGESVKTLDLLVLEKKIRETGIRLSGQILDRALVKNRLGSGSILTILQAQDNLQRARKNLTTTIINYAKKKLQIEVLVGSIKKRIDFDPNILFTETPSKIVNALLWSEVRK